MKNKKLIGFIGQGWIGKHYADDFEKRGYNVVRYALEEPYKSNGHKIKECDIVFIAVPTPTNKNGFDDSILRKAIKSVGHGKIAVIKSTVLPGITESIQEENPEFFVLHSPEFLREKTAAKDAANPKRNIIGIPKDTREYKEKAKDVMSVLPKAPFEQICNAREAELVKYLGNCLLATKVLFMNMAYDLAEKLGCDWDKVSSAAAADKRLGDTHWQVVHASNNEMKPGRGFGGHCFPKDFAAFREMYAREVGDAEGLRVLDEIVNKNLKYLKESGKDQEIIGEIYGEKP